MMAQELRRKASEVVTFSSPSYGQRSGTKDLMLRAAAHIESLEKKNDELARELRIQRGDLC